MTPEPQGMYTISFGLHREKGPVRQENQDQILHFQSSVFGHVFVVADGMGGHAGGAIAANMAITGFKQHFQKVSLHLSLRESIAEAARLTNLDIFEKSNESGDGPNPLRMGSTLVLCVVAGNSYTVANAGDSRCYSFRNGDLRKLTKDHTAVQKMVDSGILSPEEAKNHPEASVLTRAFGQRPEIEIDVYEPATITPDECLLLCSDGLYGYVDEALIADRLRRYSDPQAAADALLQLALDAGGHDNISIFVIRVGPPALTDGTARAGTAPDPPEPELPVALAASIPLPDSAGAVTPVAKAALPTASAPIARRNTGNRPVLWLFALLIPVLLVSGAAAALVLLRPDLIPGAVRDRLAAWGLQVAPQAVVVDQPEPVPVAGRGKTAKAPESAKPLDVPAPSDPPLSPPVAAVGPAPVEAPPTDPKPQANVYIVYPHTGSQTFVQGITVFRDRLTERGFTARLTEKPIATSKVWRVVVENPASFAPTQALVSAVYRPGYKKDALEICRIVGCSAPAPKLLGPPDRALFASEFAGGEVILFTHPPVVGQSPPPAPPQ